MEFNAVPTFTSGHHHASSSSQVRGGAVAAQRKKKPQLSTPVSTRHPRVGGHNTPMMSTHTTAAASSAARRKSQSELERSQLEPPTASDHPRQPVAATVASTTSPLFHTPNGGGTVARPTQNSAGGGSAGGAANSDDENFEPCLSVQRPRFAELFEGGGGGSRKPSGSIASPLRSAGRSLPPLAPAAVAAPPSPFVMSKKPPLHNNHNNTSSPNVSRSLINESDYNEGGGEKAAESCKEDIERLLNDSEDVTPQLEEDAPRPHPQQHLSPGRSQPLPPRPATSDPPMPTPQQRSALPPDARGSSLEFEGGDQHFISDQEEERRSSKRLFLVADPEDFLMDPSAPTSDNERESNVQDVATPLSPTFDARAATVSTVHQGEVVVAPKSQAPQTNSSHQPATNIARRQAPGRRDIDASSASQGAFLRHLPEPAAYDDAQAVVSFFEGVAFSEPSLPITSVSKPQRPVRRGNASESSVSAPPPPSSALPMVGEQSQEELLVAAATQRQQRASAERTTSFEESAASSLSTRSGGRVPSTSPPPPAPLLVEGSSPSNATQSPKSRRAPLATHLAGDTSPSPKKFSPQGGGAPLSADIVAPSLIVIGSPSASTTSNPFAGLDLSFKSDATNRRESPQHAERPKRNVVDEPPRSTVPSVVAVVDDDGDRSANEQQRGVSVASSSSSSSQHVATSTDDLIDTVISNPTPIVAAVDDNPPSSVGASSDKGGSSAPRTPTRTSRQKAHDAIKTSHRVPPQEPYLVRESIMNLVNASLSASPVTSLRAEGTAIAIDSAATHTADVESPPNIPTSVRTTMPEETLPALAAASSSMVLSPPRLQRSDTSPSASVNSPRRQDEVTGTAITTTTPTAGTTTTTTTAAVALAPQPVHGGGMLDSTSISSSVVAAASETRAQPQLATFDVFAPTDTTEASTLLNLSASPPPPTLRLGSNARRSVSGGNNSASAIPSSSAIAAAAPVVDPTASMMAADASASGISMFSQQAAQDFHSSSVVVAHDDVMSLEEPAHSPLISLAPTNSAISPPQQQLGIPPLPRTASSAASLDRSLTNDNMGVSSHLLHSSNVQPLLSSNNNPSGVMKSVQNQHESSDAASSVRAVPAAAVVGSSVTSEQEGGNESFDGLRASMRSDDAESPFMITTTATAEPSPKSPLAATSSSFHAAVGSPRVASRSPKNDAVQRALKECFDTLIEQKTDAPPRNLNISTAIEGSPLRRSGSLRTGKQLLQTSPRVSDSQQSSPKKKLSLSHNTAGGVEGGVDAADFMNDGGTPLKRHGSSTTTAMVPSSPWKPPTSPAPPNLRHSFQFSEPPMFAEGSSPTAALNARQLSSARIDGRVPSFSPENKSPVQIEETTEVLHHQAASSNNRLGEPVRRLPSAEFLPSVLYQHDDGNLLRRSTSQDSGGVSVADREALEEHLRALDIADSAAAARPASNLVSAQGDSIDFSFPFRRDELQLQQFALHQQYQRQNHKNAGNHGENEVDYDDGDYEDDDDDDEPRMADVTINISLAPALYKKPSSSSNDSPSRQRHSSVSVAALNDVFSFAANAPSAGNREDIAGTSLLPSAQPIVRVQRGAAQPTATHMLLEGASGQHWTVAASRHHIDDDGSLLSQRSPLPKMRVVGNSHPNNSAATPPTSAIILPNDEEDVDGTSRALVLAPITSSLSVAGGSSAAVVVVGSNISSGVDTAATLLPPPVFPNIYQDIAVVDPRAVSEEWREGLRHEPIKNPSWIQGWGGAENFLGEEVVEGNRPSVDEEVDVHVLSGNRKKLTTLPTIVVGKQKPFGFTQPPPQMTTDDDDEQVSRKEIAARPPHHHASLDGIDSGDDATHPVEWMTPPPSSRRLQRKDFTPLKHVPAAAAAASCIPSEPLAVSRRSVNNVAHLSEKEQQDETQRRLRILRAIGSGSGGVSVGAADDVKLKHHYVSPLDDTLAPLSDGEGSVAVAAAAAHPVPPPSSLGSSAASLFGGERQDSEGSPNIRIPNNISTASVHHDNDSAAALSRNATVAGGSKHVLFAPSTATVDQNTSVASSNFSTSGPRFLLEHLIATQQQRQKTRLAALVSPATHDNDDDDEAIGSTSPNADKNGHSSNAAHLVSTPTTVSIQHAATTTTPTFEALAARRHEMRLKSIHSALSSIQRDRAEADERHLRRGSPHGRDVMTVVEARRQSYTTTTVTTTTAATAAVAVPPAWSPRPVPAAAPANSALFARDMRNVILGLKSTAAGLAAPSLPPPLTDGGEHHRSAVLLTPHSFVVTSDE